MRIQIQHLYAAVRLEVGLYDRSSAKQLEPLSGTAFFVGDAPDDGASIYLVTNEHMYRPDRERWVVVDWGNVWVSGHFQPNGDDSDPSAFRFRLPTERRPALPGNDADVAVTMFRRVEDWTGPERITFNWYPLEMLATEEDFRSRLLLGDEVCVLGYPGFRGTQMTRPIAVQGVLSSDPRFSVEYADGDYADTVLCQSFSWGGMSGAPVVVGPSRYPENRVLGVNAGHTQPGCTDAVPVIASNRFGS